MAKKLIKKDIILMFSAITALIISGFVIWQFSYINQYEYNSSKIPEIVGKATLTIDFGSGKKRSFEGDIVENETFADILNQASKAGSFSYKLDGESRLVAVESFLKDDKKFWQSYVNNQKINKPLSEIIIKNGDDILIKYN